MLRPTHWIVGLLILLMCLPGAGAAKNPDRTITLAAVGDILLDRGVGEKIAKYGTTYPFAQVRGILRSADITFGNLECPLSKRGTKILRPFCFQAPPRTVACLIDGGLDVVSLANNHTLDCGRTGLTETMETLRKTKIGWCGAGRNRTEAEAALVKKVKGIRLAFVGFTDVLPEGIFGGDGKPTIAYASEQAIRKAVQRARRQADIVIVSCHWGSEYESRPGAQQKQLARAAAEAGADLILGHHPHVLQGLERFRSPDGKRSALIAYSLGNFVFDPRRERAAQSAILRCTMSKRGIVDAQLIPVQIAACRPCPAREAQAAQILSRLATLSNERNLRVVNGRISP